MPGITNSINPAIIIAPATSEKIIIFIERFATIPRDGTFHLVSSLLVNRDVMMTKKATLPAISAYSSTGIKTLAMLSQPTQPQK